MELSSRFVSATGSFNPAYSLGGAQTNVGNIQCRSRSNIVRMYGFFFIVSALLWGILADRIGLRKSLTMACLMLSIGIIGMGTINSTFGGMIFYSFIGFSAAAPITLSALLTGAWFDRAQKRDSSKLYQ